MNRWIKKLHMYCGLLNFSILLVFGIAGLTATFQAAPEKRVRPAPAVRLVDYTAPPGFSDKQVADDVYRLLQVPFTNPEPAWALRRDRDNNLTFTLYSVNGINRVTVLEKENRVRVETVRNSVWHYLDSLHATTMQRQRGDWRLRLWGYYNEFAIWSLIGMAVSGLYLWLSSRSGYRAAQLVFLGGSGIFAVLYFLSRRDMYAWFRNTHLFLGIFGCLFLLAYGVSSVQMAHNTWFGLRPRVSESRVTIRPENTSSARAVARQLMDEQGMRGELTQVRQSEEGYKFRLVRPGVVYEVDYSQRTGEATVRANIATFMGLLNRIHHQGGVWHDYALLNFWGVLVGVVSAALIVMGLTGIYLWFQFHNERVIGAVLLVINLGYSLTLMILVRTA